MVTVLESLNCGLRKAMATDSRVYLLGEDLLDPYGGAFKVTRGLSTEFPDRVITTPISEAGITGVATGMAMRGLRPVLEIMFGDFVTLAADQLINHAAKFRWMYNDQVRVPLVVRTPMGGRRGYGPTHSQTLEKIFLGIPGLRVVAPCHLGDPGEMLCEIILNTQDPVLFIENKLQYLLPVNDGWGEFEELTNPDGSPNEYLLTIRGAPPATVTLATYGYIAELSRQAVEKLAYEDEIFVELVLVSQLAPMSINQLSNSVNRTRKLLVVEEASQVSGWGAEVIAQVANSMQSERTMFKRLAARDTPIPAAKSLEEATLPDVEDIVNAVRKMV
jgi:pyruvate/2-oxoglutarate/acetoin dehydrogenase E1 component